MGVGFTRERDEDSSGAGGGVGTLSTSGDPLPSLRGSPQPASDLVEVGEELREERSEIVGREDTVEIEEALVDMIVRGRWWSRVKRGKRQDGVFCMR